MLKPVIKMAQNMVSQCPPSRTNQLQEVAPVQHMLLMEVYNGLNVIHQAEGPHPRRWPRMDAWTWLQEWAEQEGLRPDGPEGVPWQPWFKMNWDPTPRYLRWTLRFEGFLFRLFWNVIFLILLWYLIVEGCSTAWSFDHCFIPIVHDCSVSSGQWATFPFLDEKHPWKSIWDTAHPPVPKSGRAIVHLIVDILKNACAVHNQFHVEALKGSLILTNSRWLLAPMAATTGAGTAGTFDGASCGNRRLEGSQSWICWMIHDSTCWLYTNVWCMPID